MTHPPQPTDSSVGMTSGPRTQEIPAVVPPPPSRDTAELPTAAPAQDAAAFVPGFAAPQPAAYPPPAEPRSSRRWSHGPRRRAIAFGVALVMLALLLLTWGLSVGREPLWETATLWSVFAFACALALLLSFVPDAPRRRRSQQRLGRRIALGGLAGLGVSWLVLALPQAASNRGFLLTAALAAAVAAVWTDPDRPAAGGR